MGWAAPIHFINEGYPRDVIPTHLTINRSSLALNTRNSTQNQDGTIKHTQGTLDLYRKVDVSCIISRVSERRSRIKKITDLECQ